MSRLLSTSLKEAIFAQESSDVVLVLLTISHPDLADDIRVCSDAVNITSNGNEFIAYPFELILPDDTDSSSPRAKLSVDNTDRVIVQAVRSINSAPTVLIQLIRAAAPDVIEAEYVDFKLMNISYDANTVSGELTVEDFTTEPFPYAQFTPSYFPGLFA